MSSARFVMVDRETPFLMPPDLRDWVKDDDLAHFLVEAVKRFDCSIAQINHRGSGSEQYPPAMMLATLIYCYSSGIFASRQIETATYRNISVRYITGDTHPDHDTICKFRRENGGLIRQVFNYVLDVGALCGLGQVGTICIDGTKILANACKPHSYTLKQLEEMEQRVGKQIEMLLEQAEKADQEKKPEGDTLPKELRSKKELKKRIEAAQEQLREMTRQRAEEREKERETVRKEKFGRFPEKLSPIPAEDATINLADPESRIMPSAVGGYIQGYNGQIAISGEAEGGLILATHVCTDTNDRLQLEPMVRALPEKILSKKELEIGVDTGYDNVVQIRRIEQGCGVIVYCSPQKKSKKTAAVTEEDKEEKSKLSRVTQSIKAARDYRQKIAERAETAYGKSILKLRSTTVEPAFGIIKQTMKWRRASLRGKEKVDLEFRLVGLAFNCRRLSARFGKTLLEKLKQSQDPG